MTYRRTWYRASESHIPYPNRGIMRCLYMESCIYRGQKRILGLSREVNLIHCDNRLVSIFNSVATRAVGESGLVIGSCTVTVVVTPC